MHRVFGSIVVFLVISQGGLTSDAAFCQPTKEIPDPNEKETQRAIKEIEKAGAILTGPGGANPKKIDTLLCLPSSDMKVVIKEIPHLRDLTNIQLRKVGTDDHLKVMSFLKLNQLDLTDSQITDVGINHISKQVGLNSLVLTGTKVGDASLNDISKFVELYRLYLDNTLITGKEIKSLTALKGLRQLALGPKISDAALKDIANIPALTELYLPGAEITGKGIKEIAMMKGITTLSLSGCKLRDEDLKDFQALPELSGLWLINCAGISDKGLVHLLSAKNVQTLHLSGNDITDGGILQLVGLPKLRQLGIGRTKVTEEGAKTFKQFRSDVNVVFR